MTVGSIGIMPDKDGKNNRKLKPQYWRIIQFLRKLKLKYREKDRGEPSFHITVDDFGTVLRFNPRQSMGAYKDWDVVDVDLKAYKKNPIPFGEEFMWFLISKGYMAYLRNEESGNSQVYRYFLITEGWALRIIDKRLELYNNEPRHKFLIKRNQRLREYPISYIVMHHPDFFDYLV